MRAVWKYPLDLRDGTTHHYEIPMGGVVRHVGVQRTAFHDSVLGSVTEGDTIMMWVEVDPDEPKTHRTFQIVGTGHEEVGYGFVYAGTVQMGQWVWHIYETTVS